MCMCFIYVEIGYEWAIPIQGEWNSAFIKNRCGKCSVHAGLDMTSYDLYGTGHLPLT